MKIKPIIIVGGEPNSIFFEIFFKALKSKTFKSPIILIMSLDLINKQMNYLKYKKNINLIKIKDIKKIKLDNKKINVIDIKYNNKVAFKKISKVSNRYIEKCFNMAFYLIKNNISNKFINGPINKKTFLKKKYLGVTEYICEKFKVKKNAMLIYNKELSVCPITTHLPVKLVSKNIKKNSIYHKVILINDFYKKMFGIKPKIAVTGLNPHCETIDKFDEDNKIIKPAIKKLKNKKVNIQGPFPADTIFMERIRSNYDVIVGMYHDQVLSPIKTLFEYNAINITLGLPFIRVSPDHGPNEKMMGKNSSNPQSLIDALNFLDF